MGGLAFGDAAHRVANLCAPVGVGLMVGHERAKRLADAAFDSAGDEAVWAAAASGSWHVTVALHARRDS